MRSVHGFDRRCSRITPARSWTHTGERQADQGPSRAWPAPMASCTRCNRVSSDEQGFQCAFCMSGFIMATVGFLKVNPNPTRPELAHGISGNLCRLSGLRQDPHRHDARRGEPEKGDCNMSRTICTRQAQRNQARLQTDRAKLHQPRTWWRRSPAALVCRRLSVAEDAVRQLLLSSMPTRTNSKASIPRKRSPCPALKAILTAEVTISAPADAMRIWSSDPGNKLGERV